MSSFRPLVDRRLEDVLADLRAFIELESPTVDKEACDRAGRHLAEQFRAYARAEIVWHPQDRYGDHFEARVGDGARRILLLGHSDTVWPVGTIRRLPCRIEGDRLTGPGSFDMKYGDVQALWGLRLVTEGRLGAGKTFVFFGNSDEEVGSPTSRPIIERLARDAECVLVLEPAVGPEGAIKLWRKGIGIYHLDVDGIASHAGADPEQGRSAILELAHQVVDLQGLNNAATGTTLNVGVIRGGTRANVVAAGAEAEIDLRVRTSEEARLAHERILNRPTFVAGTTVHVRGGLNRPPWRRARALTGSTRWPSGSRRKRDSLCPRGGRAAAAMGTSRRRSGCPPSMVWARWGMVDTPIMSTCGCPPSHPALPGSPGCWLNCNIGPGEAYILGLARCRDAVGPRRVRCPMPPSWRRPVEKPSSSRLCHIGFL